MENKRPILVTIICILGFIGVPATFIGVLFNLFSPVGLMSPELAMPLWYSIFSLIIVIPYLIALIFVWKMRKIGLIAYTGLAVLEYLVGFISGFATIVGLIISAIFIGLLWTQFKKMS